MMLAIENLHVYYGGIHALKGISLSVPEGQVVTLIGTNGAGKSTTLRTICGFVSPKEGHIVFEGQDIGAVKAPERVKLGIAMVPEGRRVFTNLTVYENLLMGAYLRNDEGGIKHDLERIYALFPVLTERRSQRAITLSGGEQQMLAVGRGLMGHPELMMFDEPSLGLSPILVQQIFDIVKKINEEGVTVLLVEQNVTQTLAMCHRAYVLENGRVALNGTGKELMNNDHVREAYLGI